MNTTKDTAKEQARAQLDGIIEMVKAMEEARDADEFGMYQGEEVTMDDMIERIQEDPLSVEVRADWHTPGDNDNKPTEYKILLCTGGPACRIIGELNEYQAPENARIEYQDWGTPWTEYRDTTTEEDDMLLQYANQFYFGE